MQGIILYSCLQKYRRNCNRKAARNRYNTPAIIKYPFWRMTAQNKAATYACINYGEALCPAEIEKQSICIDEDIGRVLRDLK